MVIEPTVPEFARVWQRVQATGQPTEADETPTPEESDARSEPAVPMQELLQREAALRRGYQVLGLGQCVRASQRRTRHLSCACFLLTGARPEPGPEGERPAFSARAEGLRSQFFAEGELAQRYRACAESCPDPDVAELFQELALSCQSSRRALIQLLTQT
ncbi:MAG: hypothetical protein IJ751_03690 [Oscillospiraceae bacterium]|nr:hypothetical protein [Oscillospiraceae bacterium]